MYKLDEFCTSLEKFAPLYLSGEMIKKGCYDNSGIIVRATDKVEKVLFTLDLTERAVKKAKRLGVDTIVTHHPAIYSPISQLDVFEGGQKAVSLALKNSLNVISFHLNLDVAKGGIDDCLANALGGEKLEIIDKIDQENGYGRTFCVKETTLSQLAKEIKNKFSTKRLLVYGNKKQVITKIASFCGAGGGEGLKAVAEGKTDAQVIVSSDIKHNVIVELVERGKCVIAITHYASENLGFKHFYERVKQSSRIDAYYLEDERFL